MSKRDMRAVSTIAFTATNRLHTVRSALFGSEICCSGVKDVPKVCNPVLASIIDARGHPLRQWAWRWCWRLLKKGSPMWGGDLRFLLSFKRTHQSSFCSEKTSVNLVQGFTADIAMSVAIHARKHVSAHAKLPKSVQYSFQRPVVAKTANGDGSRLKRCVYEGGSAFTCISREVSRNDLPHDIIRGRSHGTGKSEKMVAFRIHAFSFRDRTNHR